MPKRASSKKTRPQEKRVTPKRPSSRKTRPLEVNSGRLLISVDETARLLGVSRRTIYRLNGLPSVKLGGSRMFRVQDVVAYVESLDAAPYCSA